MLSYKRFLRWLVSVSVPLKRIVAVQEAHMVRLHFYGLSRRPSVDYVSQHHRSGRLYVEMERIPLKVGVARARTLTEFLSIKKWGPNPALLNGHCQHRIRDDGRFPDAHFKSTQNYGSHCVLFFVLQLEFEPSHYRLSFYSAWPENQTLRFDGG
jgi:hypothetical protein